MIRRRDASGSNPRAFTLVEILVVIVILGILTALVLPALGSSRESAQMTQSLSNIRQLVTANNAYAADNGRYCPADDRWNNKRWHGGRSTASEPFDPAKGYLADYLGQSRKIGVCPKFQEMMHTENSFEQGTGGYGYNASYIGGRPTWAFDSSGARVSALPSQIQKMNTVMFTTSGYAQGNTIQEYPYSEPPFWDFGDGPTGWRPSPSVHFRFQGKALVGWADGRVTAVACDPREVGYNPHQGDANAQALGWFGPDENNGYWNPQ